MTLLAMASEASVRVIFLQEDQMSDSYDSRRLGHMVTAGWKLGEARTSKVRQMRAFGFREEDDWVLACYQAS